MKSLFFSLLTSLIFFTSIAKSDENTTWQLPLTLNDQNTKVSFEIDTTWHVVYGKISDTTGNISLKDSNNPLSVISEIHFPVSKFNTGWDKRDQSLHEHMKAEKYTDVVLKSTALKGDCSPSIVNKSSCKAKLVGTLSICDVTKDIEIDVEIVKNDKNYEVKGAYSFKWADYNVEDPSIIVAKVDPVVKVIYAVTIPAVAQLKK